MNVKTRSLNDSICIMLRSYARSIQRQEHMIGSLFQEHTKAVCLTQPEEISFSWFYRNYDLQDGLTIDGKDYISVCIQYIHENPDNEGLCTSMVDREFSSAPDNFGNRKGKLINRERAKQFELI